MFKIEFFVDDKNLAPVLRGVTGQVRDLRVVPVVNAAPAPGGKVKAKSGSTLDMFRDAFAELKPEVINAASLRMVTKHLGYAETSYSHFMKQLVDAGLLKKNKSSSPQNTTYTLVK